VGCVPVFGGGSRAYLANGYEKYERADGPGVVTKPCEWYTYFKPTCTGERLGPDSEQKRCCDWRIASSGQ
ncbi:MAG: hypothetical protein HRF45_07760, partial [Fimbriimonadia bacterium]